MKRPLMLQLKQVFPPRAGLLILVLVGWLAGHAAAEPGVTVAGYCQAFARTFCAQQALASQEQSVSLAPHSALFQGLSNLFQPPDSTFTAGYQCAFRARTPDGPAQPFAVSLLLTRTLSFAEHTQWERLQILPITYVTDETTGRAGYGVFKYLEPSS